MAWPGSLPHLIPHQKSLSVSLYERETTHRAKSIVPLCKRGMKGVFQGGWVGKDEKGKEELLPLLDAPPI
jgi:hypothetical protein